MPPRRLVLDTNCFIDASKHDAAGAAYRAFTDLAAPRLNLSSVVAAELRAGVVSVSGQRRLEQQVLLPYERRGRVLTPSANAWRALGHTLAALVRGEGLQLKTTARGFILDILIAYSCRENGAILISANARDLGRIARVFAFEYVAPYPDLASL